MSASKGMTGRGTILSIGIAGSPETFTPVLQLRTFQPSGQSAKYEDLTNADSPTNANGNVVVEETLPTTISPGTYAFGGVFLPSDPGQLALLTAFETQALTDFKLQLLKGPGQAATGNLYAFSGYVQDMPLPDVDYSKIATFKVTIKITGVIARTPGA